MDTDAVTVVDQPPDEAARGTKTTHVVFIPEH